MSVLILDVEATGALRNKAHPFDERNKVTHIGIKELNEKEELYEIEYADRPYGEALRTVQDRVSSTRMLVGANIKYDLHWLRRYGINFDDVKLFDISLAFFILRGQAKAYPSLDEMAEYYGVDKKLDIVKTEYWEKGYDTDEVPKDILEDYLAQDLKTTEGVFTKITEEMATQSPEMVRTIQLAMLDGLVLEEMESNGMLYDKEESQQIGDALESSLQEDEQKLREFLGLDWFSSTSSQHKSAILFGGTLKFKEREKYEYIYKDGSMALKERWTTVKKKISGMFPPAYGKELATEGFFSTDEGTLVSLLPLAKVGSKVFIQSLLAMAKKEKRRSTYFHGFPKQIDTYNWFDNIIHTSLNQVVAVTGRLSSSKPNLQNIEEQVKKMFKSRFSIRRR